MTEVAYARYEKTVGYSLPRGDVEAQVAKWNTRVRRHGMHVTIVDARDFQVDRNWFPGDDKKLWKTTYVIEAPEVAGEAGRVVGTFELAEDGKAVYAVPAPNFTSADLDPFRARWDGCDHCRTKRARGASFVVQREDGSRLVVGRSCAVAYMGLSFQAIVAGMGAAIEVRDLDEDQIGYGSTPTFPTVELLNACWVVTKAEGGYNREDRQYLTHGVWLCMGHVRSPSDHDLKRLRELKEVAEKVGPLDLQAFAAYLDGARGDFADNLRTACGLDRVLGKRLPLLVAGVGMFVGRTLKREADAKKAADRVPATLVQGEVGKRVEFTAECLRTIPYQSQFGGGLICVFRADDGQNAVWFTGAENTPDAGKTYAVRGTVKKHGVDRRTDEPQTTLSRCVVKEAAVSA